MQDQRRLNEQFKRIGTWATTITMTLVALPFLLGALYMTYRSLWFQYAAARADGTIVEISDGTPTLTVEFRTTAGETKRTESAGSDLYKDYATGDKLTVFYDPQRPADARLDLWIENWLLPILTLVPGAIIVLAMMLIVRSFREDPFARLEKGGTLVQTEFVRVRLGVDMDPEWDLKRPPGDFTLKEEDGRWELVHNGRKRDAYDPAVQRELGLCWLVETRGKDPRNGVDTVFQSEPLSSNPERLLQGVRTIPVYVDPKRPMVYRMELPFQQTRKQPQKPKAAMAGPITKL